MKLVFFGKDSLNLMRKGGVESLMRRLINALSKNEHEIFVLVAHKTQKAYIEANINENKVVFIYAKVEELQQKMLDMTYDVLNFLSTPFGDIPFLFRLLYKKRRENIYFCKLFFTYPVFKKNVRLQRLKHRFTIDKYIAFSQRLFNDLKADFPKNTYQLLPPVAEVYFEGKKENKNLKNHIAFAGRISADKGIDIVLEVFEHFQNVENVELSLFGYFVNETDKAKYAEKLAALNVKLHIVAHEKRDDKINKNYLFHESNLPFQNINILLLPYQHLKPTLDTPLILLEALAAGCQIVTSNIEHLQNIEGNISFIDKFEKAHFFIEKIQKTIDNQTVKKYDYSQYKSDVIAKNYIEIVQK